MDSDVIMAALWGPQVSWRKLAPGIPDTVAVLVTWAARDATVGRYAGPPKSEPIKGSLRVVAAVLLPEARAFFEKWIGQYRTGQLKFQRGTLKALGGHPTASQVATHNGRHGLNGLAP